MLLKTLESGFLSHDVFENKWFASFSHDVVENAVLKSKAT